jgi:hypothetical protein
MKKFIAYSMVFCILASLCACGQTGGSGKSGTPAVSVNVQTLSQTCYSDDGKTLLLKYSDQVPAVTVANSDSASSAINSALQKISTDYAKGTGEGSGGIDGSLQSAKADFAQDPDAFASGMSYSLTRTVDVARGDKAVLSFVYDGCDYTGGAHGTPYAFGVNFDAASGAELKLADIASDKDALVKFCTDYIIELTKGSDYAGVNFSDGYESAVKSIVADGSWYFSGDGLVFIADAYTLAAYSEGAFRFTVPYGKLDSLLGSKYAPAAAQTGSGGDMAIAATENEISDSTVGSVAIDKEGQKFTLTAKGNVTGVKLSAVSYNEGTDDFSDEGTYLYFSDLSSGQSIGVQASIPDVIPNLMISWRAADGTASQRLIAQSGKDGSMLLIEYGASHDLKAENITGSLPYSADPDGDNTDESIELFTAAASNSAGKLYSLRVTDGAAAAEAPTDIISGCSLWLADVDGDGEQEIMLSGTVGDDSNSAVYCWKYENGQLTAIPFTDGEGGAKADTLSGWIQDIGSSGIVVGRVLSVLGTYEGVREYEYSDGSVHTIAGTAWAFKDNSHWLTVKAALPAVSGDGAQTTLPAGSSILLTATDGISWVSYTDKNGADGTILITKSDNSLDWNIGGEADSTYFESLPYAG